MKKGKKYNDALKIAVSGMLSALSFVAMYVGTLTGVFDLCAVVVGAVGTAFAVIEIRGIYPVLIATVTGILCILLLPDKFAAFEYIVLGGFYPILKAHFEKVPLLPSYALKIVYFNVLFTLSLVLAKFVVGMTDDYIAFGIGIYVIANLFFIFYDYALSVFISVYVNRLKSKLKIKF